jgi:hypothetical protein
MITSIGAELNSPRPRNLARQRLQALTVCGSDKRYDTRYEVTHRGRLFDQLSVVDECGIG